MNNKIYISKRIVKYKIDTENTWEGDRVRKDKKTKEYKRCNVIVGYNKLKWEIWKDDRRI